MERLSYSLNGLSRTGEIPVRCERLNPSLPMNTRAEAYEDAMRDLDDHPDSVAACDHALAKLRLLYQFPQPCTVITEPAAGTEIGMKIRAVPPNAKSQF
jgi:hypothetical protein